ncbi:MAG: DUF2336 domain-containing protein [Rhodospirillales bacterium]|nr:DUF2336 domain-containing protein [Rhodospirillales bacterium]
MSADVTAANLSYEESKALAADENTDVRAAVAARADLEPEVLYFLAQDESVEVRRLVAANPQSPYQTFDLLAGDESEDVRKSLVTKIATLKPKPNDDPDGKVEGSTRDALSMLARDQVVHVRETMAAAFKDRDGVPVDIIRTLAGDAQLSVSSPVLEHSPILIDDMLLELIETGTASGNLCAISRRSTVSESVSGAVVNTNDVAAIGELLTNSSAQIQEEVLDSLIDRAADIDAWHEPLVNRPALPVGAPKKLAHFIAEQLFDTLKSRDDMDARTLAEVEQVVHDRLEAGSTSSHHGQFDFLNGPVPMDSVGRLRRSGGLQASVVVSALMAEDHKFVLAAMICLSDLSEAVVKRILSERNAKGIVSLVWKSDLPVSMITGVQQRMARIRPEDVLKPKQDPTTGRQEQFPMAEKEMEWNIEFYKDLVKRDTGLSA